MRDRKGAEMWTPRVSVNYFYPLCTFMSSLGTFQMERLFLMYNVCSKYLKHYFPPPPGQGDVLCIVSEPDVSICLPSLSGSVS